MTGARTALPRLVRTAGLYGLAAVGGAAGFVLVAAVMALLGIGLGG